jgi:hypothetical protein
MRSDRSEDCGGCRHPPSGHGAIDAQTFPPSWLGATRHPRLKGSPFVGRRGVASLYFCGSCGTLWHVVYDSREGYTVAGRLGRDIIELFAADTDVPRIVGFACSPDAMVPFRVLDDLTGMVLRRRPGQCQPAVDAVLTALDATSRLALPPDTITFLALVFVKAIERAGHGSLRGGPAPPTYVSKAMRRQQAQAMSRRFVPHVVDGRAYLAYNAWVIDRLVWEEQKARYSSVRGTAAVTIDDLAPIWRLLDHPLLAADDDGGARGSHLRTWWKMVEALEQARAPLTAHAVFMPDARWQELQRRVEPVARLAALVGELLASESLAAAERCRELRRIGVLTPDLLRDGARFTESAQEASRRLLARLDASKSNADRSAPDHDAAAAVALREILTAHAKALAADRDCSLPR